MSSIWDPPDAPELVAAERAAAERVERERAEAKTRRMRVRYAKAAACSMISEEPEQHRLGTARRAAAESPPPTRRAPPPPSPAARRRRSEAESARQRFLAELLSTMPPALAAWRPGLPLPEPTTAPWTSRALP
jgi:hypothetical protein